MGQVNELLKIGSHSQRVQVVQYWLNASGFAVSVDGWYGPATQAAVFAFQKQVGLAADGVCGPKTQEALAQRSAPAHFLKEADLIAAADRLQVPLAAVKAVNEVESRGSGFLDDGRPVILFERHVMFNRLQAAKCPADELSNAYPLLINTKRGGYEGGASEWQRMLNAGLCSNQPGIAYEAASWGLFQIMGYHWALLGYASIDDFVTAMGEGEGKQLDAFVRFIEADTGLLKALKGQKWAEFARAYNGPAYKDNLYDVKLARSFEKFSTVLA